MPSSRGSSQPRDRTQISCTAGGFFTDWATREAPYAEYIIWNAGLDDSQAGIKIVRRNINNCRYTNVTTLKAESEEELKGLLMKVKEESGKAGLKLNIQKTKIMASSPHHGKQMGKKWKQWKIFLDSKITVDGNCSHEIKRYLLAPRKKSEKWKY